MCWFGWMLIERTAPPPVIPTGAEPLDFARDRLREAQWSNCIVVGQAPTVI
jgi:hypothetical protein